MNYPALKSGRGLILLLITLLALLLPSKTYAQAKSFLWLKYDVDMTLLEDGSMHVVETQQIEFVGQFTNGFAIINTGEKGRNDGISDVSIREGGLIYEPQGSTPGRFFVSSGDEEVSIRWYFEETTGTHTYELSYTVDGVIRVDESGDQLYWSAVPDEHGGVIVMSNATIQMPPGVPILSTIAAVDGRENNGVTTAVAPDGQSATFRATQGLSYDVPFEVGVRFEHGLLPIEMPEWQRKEQANDVFQGVAIGLACLFALFAPLLVLGWWFVRGRDPQVGDIPDVISEPPSGLSPGVLGTLIDEKADMHDILSVIVDLARRGYLTMEETASDFEFARTDKQFNSLQPFERLIVKHVFGTAKKRQLSQLKRRFYKHLPALREALYDELKDEGLVTASPETTRGRYTGCGSFMLFGGVIMAFCITMLIEQLQLFVIIPGAALMLTGTLISFAGRHMPRKTEKGAEVAALSEAFKRYLLELKEFRDEGSAQEIFESYLPYAVAFGIERRWIDNFQQQKQVHSPLWYRPYYRPHRSWTGRSSSTNPASLPNLDQMSGGITSGLDTMSSSFTKMLDSTAKTMRSTPPSSSSSSGSSSFSGGFSGGSSGGGSRGFG